MGLNLFQLDKSEGFTKFITWFVIISSSIGFLIIIVSCLIKPFNDFSFNPNAELFSNYGSFIGGLITALFAIINALLLFINFNSQKNYNAKQDIQIKLQENIDVKRKNEDTFFNMLNNYMPWINAFTYSKEKPELNLSGNSIFKHLCDPYIKWINEPENQDYKKEKEVKDIKKLYDSQLRSIFGMIEVIVDFIQSNKLVQNREFYLKYFNTFISPYLKLIIVFYVMYYNSTTCKTLAPNLKIDVRSDFKNYFNEKSLGIFESQYLASLNSTKH